MLNWEGRQDDEICRCSKKMRETSKVLINGSDKWFKGRNKAFHTPHTDF